MPGAPVTLRPATAADLAVIGLIQDAAPEASQWDPAGYLTYDCAVAQENGSVIGFLASRETGAGEHEILNLAVHPSARRRGVARTLLNQAFAGGCRQWFLEVRASNVAAIRLYESVGFRQAGTRAGYYQNPLESAIVMKLDS
jgi:ribosomal-protein-alanine acetyltransferase